MRSDPDYKIEWREEGDGWIGRWFRRDDSKGSWDEFVVAPEGGLHGKWNWSNPFCSGKRADLEGAKLCAEVSYFACDLALADRDERRRKDED